MKKIFKKITFVSLGAVCALVLLLIPKQASATFVDYPYSIPYVVTAVPPPVITVDISANPNSMTLPTNQTVLTWVTTGSPDSCSAFGSWSGGYGGGNGTETKSGLAAGSYVYQIVCFKAGSVNAMDQVTVIVNPDILPNITASLVANPSVLPFGGGTTMLTWGSTNAASCTGVNFNTFGATAGTTPAILTTATTYTVICTGLSGFAQAQATVSILPDGPTVINGMCSPTHFNCAAGTSTNNVTDIAAWTWTCRGSNGGTNALCMEPRSGGGGGGGGPKPECSDTIDNTDPEDTLIDIQDPACHSDKNPNNPATYLPLKTTERDTVKPIFIEF